MRRHETVRVLSESHGRRLTSHDDLDLTTTWHVVRPGWSLESAAQEQGSTAPLALPQQRTDAPADVPPDHATIRTIGSRDALAVFVSPPTSYSECGAFVSIMKPLKTRPSTAPISAFQQVLRSLSDDVS
jgi:hypothetical protein